jgi:carboxymethylenebutenolidase
MIGLTTNRASAYVASAQPGPGTPVLLVHGWWGLNQPIKDFADRLARDGFTVLAPDLFDGTILATVEEADAHGKQADEDYERILGRVEVALDEVLAHPDARGQHAGIVALSFGAWYGNQAAGKRPEVTALVVVYGDVFEAPQGVAYLGHFAEHDTSVDSSQVPVDLGDRGQAYIYPDTKHWFIESDRPEYDADAAELVHERTVEFLQQHVG